MDTIVNLTAQETKREPLISQVKNPLNNLSKEEHFNVVQKASEDCLLVCNSSWKYPDIFKYEPFLSGFKILPVRT